MSLIIILLAVFNNFAIRRLFLTTLRSGALICYHRRPILLLVPPQSRKRGYAPGWSNQDPVWDMDSGGLKELHVL